MSKGRNGGAGTAKAVFRWNYDRPRMDRRFQGEIRDRTLPPVLSRLWVRDKPMAS